MLRIRFTCILLFYLHSILSGQDQSHWESLINAEFIWKYQTGSESIPSNWMESGFNDTFWESGSGGIGYGDDDDNTLISNTLSVYMRHSFQIADREDILDLRLYIDYDDGFIAYLNGIEIARGNMDHAGTEPEYDVLADDCDHEANIPRGGTPDLFHIEDNPVSLLVNGTNTLAIQVHNCSSTSSDMSSSAWLIARISGDNTLFHETPDWFHPPPEGSFLLPLVLIDTDGENIPDEPKITANMKIIYNGEGNLNNVTDINYVYDGYVGIEVRGQSSQGLFPKDSYTVETRDSTGEDLKVPLLGMPEESDWVLYAPYSDKSLLRNAVSYHFARQMGNWAPRFKFCEVYLNGDYQGIYLMMEKIKRDRDRVDIEKTWETHNAGDSLTGGYILRVDKRDGLSEYLDYFYTAPEYDYPNSRSYAFGYYYPEAHKITTQQKAYIQNFLYEAESSLNSPDFLDEEHGYSHYFDLNSFVDYQIIKEFGNDVDGYRFSTYFFKNADSKNPKLHAGPVWDHNLCFGNVNYSETALSTDIFRYTHIGTNEGYSMHWWYRMMEDDDYVWRLHKRYSEYRNTVFSNEAVMTYIDEQVYYLGDAISRNFDRWPILGIEIWPNYFIGDTYQEEIYYLKSWIGLRLEFMDSQWYEILSSPGLQLSNEHEISVYPNPFSTTIRIDTENPVDQVLSVKIYNLTGQLIHQTATNYNTNIYLEFLENGMYFLSVMDDTGELGIVKILKQ